MKNKIKYDDDPRDFFIGIFVASGMTFAILGFILFIIWIIQKAMVK
jgi:preprotein translocase subunit Sss1